MSQINHVHLFFEQSGTWKRAFAKHGIPATDYDIENQFGQTDVVCDLFDVINTAYYTTDKTLFDNITPEDLIIAFFPCTYFCEVNMMYFCGNQLNYRNHTKTFILNDIIKRATERHTYYERLLQLCYVVESRKLRLIVENPYSALHYLFRNFPYKPMIDRNRYQRGDNFKKNTQYFFVNCEPYQLYTYSVNTKLKKQKSMNKGIERSLMTDTYAENFICDVILGKQRKNTQTALIF